MVRNIVPLGLAVILASPAAAQECNTLNEKMDAIDVFVLEHHGKDVWARTLINPLGGASDPIDIHFSPDEETCRDRLVVNGSCEIEVLETLCGLERTQKISANSRPPAALTMRLTPDQKAEIANIATNLKAYARRADEIATTLRMQWGVYGGVERRLISLAEETESIAGRFEEISIHD